jgi:archaellum component FlaC
MKSDERLNRLEDKVDGVKTEVSELRTEFKVHSTLVAEKLEIFDSHITGDNKIINHIQPLLERLPDIVEVVEDVRFQKKKQEEKNQKMKKISAKLAIIATIVGIGAGLVKIFGA